jgi:hypothetical protein
MRLQVCVLVHVHLYTCTCTRVLACVYTPSTTRAMRQRLGNTRGAIRMRGEEHDVEGDAAAAAAAAPPQLRAVSGGDEARSGRGCGDGCGDGGTDGCGAGGAGEGDVLILPRPEVRASWAGCRRAKRTSGGTRGREGKEMARGREIVRERQRLRERLREREGFTKERFEGAPPPLSLCPLRLSCTNPGRPRSRRDRECQTPMEMI